MKIHTNLNQLPTLTNTVITIGAFDGVHMAHKCLLQKMRDKAAKIGAETLLVTFDPHPAKILDPEHYLADFFMLNTKSEKYDLLTAAGLDHLVILPFNAELIQMEAEDFVISVLCEKLKMKHIFIGYNHNFGRGKAGNYTLLQRLSTRLHFTVEQLEKQTLTEDESISSSNIRKALLRGDVQTANAMLGYPYSLTGKLTRGAFKVFDIDKLIPEEGFYDVQVIANNMIFNTVCSIGEEILFEELPKNIDRTSVRVLFL